MFFIPGLFIAIPAGEEHYTVRGRRVIDEDCMLYSIFPHMHLIGKTIKVTMTPPDGITQTLVGINDWDFNWQGDYFFKEPIRVKAGTRFDVECVYDNSAKNPANPFNPPRMIIPGVQTTDEMSLAGLGITSIDQKTSKRQGYIGQKVRTAEK